jgi:hypothetical protein
MSRLKMLYLLAKWQARKIYNHLISSFKMPWPTALVAGYGCNMFQYEAFLDRDTE